MPYFEKFHTKCEALMPLPCLWTAEGFAAEVSFFALQTADCVINDVPHVLGGNHA
jgi:hypothetical protein